MFTVYILQSRTTQKYYIGYTNNINDRLIRHNSARNRSTKYGIPWEIIYSEQFAFKVDAIQREKQIKSYKSGDGFKKLIHGE